MTSPAMPAAPALQAGALRLEPQTAAHAREMFELLGDPAIYEFENAPPPSLAWLELRFQRLEAGGPPDHSERWFNWVVRLPDGRLAGYVQATLPPEGYCVVGYELASAYWRRGIGSAALSCVLEALRSGHQVRAFAAVLKTANYRSFGLLTKLGFVEGSAEDRIALEAGLDETVMVRAAEQLAPFDWQPTSGDFEPPAPLTAI